MECANEGELREKQEYLVLPPVPTSFSTCIFTTCASLTISVIFLNYTLMKYTQSQSGICKANVRVCSTGAEENQLSSCYSNTKPGISRSSTTAAAQQGFQVKSLHNMMVMSFSAIIMSLSDGNKMEYLSLLLVHSENMQICQSSLYLDRNKIH